MDEASDFVWQARIAAALGRRSGALQVASFGVALIACIGAVGFSKTAMAAILIPQAIMAGVSLTLGFRTALDAELFDALAADRDVEGFDRAMLSLGFMAPGKTGRTQSERVAGLVRLLRWQAGALAAQMALAPASLFIVNWAA